jgi:hypothetical protein
VDVVGRAGIRSKDGLSASSPGALSPLLLTTVTTSYRYCWYRNENRPDSTSKPTLNPPGRVLRLLTVFSSLRGILWILAIETRAQGKPGLKDSPTATQLSWNQLFSEQSVSGVHVRGISLRLIKINELGEANGRRTARSRGTDPFSPSLRNGARSLSCYVHRGQPYNH